MNVYDTEKHKFINMFEWIRTRVKDLHDLIDFFNGLQLPVFLDFHYKDEREAISYKDFNHYLIDDLLLFNYPNKDEAVDIDIKEPCEASCFFSINNELCYELIKITLRENGIYIVETYLGSDRPRHLENLENNEE